jgi:hypothetical protein
VLKGRVALANPTGELTLGVGEIGYVADADTQPELRPDLSWLFALYASPEEDGGGAGDDASGEPDTGEIDRVLTEMAPGQPVVTTGPLAFVIGTDVGGSPVYTGAFINSPVQVAAGGELTYADGGVGDITLVDATGGAIGLLSSGSSATGDSTINWGAYDSAYFSLEPNTIAVTTLHFINATQVLATIKDLPTTGSFTYDYVGDSGVAGAILNSASNLQVDFGNGTMSVELISGTDTWSGTNEAIASFYGTGMALSNPGLGTIGTINGRFVGSNAEGAMTSFSLDITDGYVTGTAAFAR